MSSIFKEKKNKKKINICPQATIDSIHNEKISNFELNKKNIIQLKKDLQLLLDKHKTLSKIPNNQLSDEDLEKKLIVLDEIKELKKKIEEIESEKSPNKYLLNTSNILFEYYEKNNENKTEKISVLDLFNNKSNNNNNDNIIDNYLNYVNNTYITKKKNNNNNNSEFKDLYYCNICNNEKIFDSNEGIILCTHCGIQEKILVDTDKPSYKDPPREISYFAYKKINHFNEWLAQFQAKETTDITPEVYEKIINELKKENINFKTVKQKKIRETLKKLNLNKYYEHVPHILNRLSGRPAPKIPRETEEKLRIMFKDIQTPWQKHCPKDRSNFLSYAYVLYKCLQLLDEDEYLQEFNLLKSREKLAEQDALWKLICKDLQWQYIKTI